jgi:O-glycosyl hydrolase
MELFESKEVNNSNTSFAENSDISNVSVAINVSTDVIDIKYNITKNNI